MFQLRNKYKFWKKISKTINIGDKCIFSIRRLNTLYYLLKRILNRKYDENDFISIFKRDNMSSNMEILLSLYSLNNTDKQELFVEMLRIYICDLIHSPKINSVCGTFLLPITAYKWCVNWWNNNSSRQSGYDLDLPAFSIKKIIENEKILEDEIYTLISAYYQSGKTFLVILLVIIYLSSGITPVIVVKKSGDVTQLKRRMKEIFSDFVNDMIIYGYYQEELSMFNSILYKSSFEKPKDEKAISHSIEGVEPKCIIVLRHHVQIGRLNSMKTDNSKIALFIDEAHACGGYRRVDEDGNFLHGNEEDGDDVKRVDTEITELKKSSCKIFLITATPSNILISEPKLYVNFIYHKKNNEFYRGPEDIIHKTIKNDKNVVADIITKLSHKPIISRSKGNTTDYHPIIVLLHFQRKIEEQEGFLRSFYSGDSSFYETVSEADWLVFTYNGDGIRLWHRSFIKKNRLRINGITCKDASSGEFLFPKLEPCDLLDWLAMNGGVEKFPRICIIGYDMVIEGISLSTKNEPGWHLTHIAIIGNHDPDYLCQLTYRLAGNHGDDMELTAMMTHINKKKVLKYVYTTNYLIDNLLLYQGCENKKVKDIIKNFEIFENRIPPKFISLNRSKDKSFYQIIDNPDQSTEDKIIKNKEEAIHSLYTFDNERYQEAYTAFENKQNNKGVKKKSRTITLEDEEDKWLRVIESSLETISKSYYYRVLDYFVTTEKYGIVMTKANLLSEISGEDEDKNKMSSTSWSWHKYGSGFCEEVRGDESGLLFKIRDGIWFVKCNN